MHEKNNPSIKCSVASCAYHGGKVDYCTLNEINVGCCTSSVADSGATECVSFRLGDRGTSCRH